MSAPFHERGASTMDRLLATAKRNPEGALLAAAGIFLMMRGMGGRNGIFGSSPGASGSIARSASTAAGTGHEDRRSMMDTARERASEFGGRMRQSAEEVAGYADHMRRAAMDTSGRVIDQSSRALDRTTSTVRSGVGHVVEEQPLALALLGLAAGAAVAALLPPTVIEERTLGPIGERMTEEAEEAGRRLKESAAEAGKRLAGEGLSEAARTVARHFKGDPDSSSGDQPVPSQTARASWSKSASASPAGAGDKTDSATPGGARETGAGASETGSGPSLGEWSSGTGRQGDVH